KAAKPFDGDNRTFAEQPAHRMDRLFPCQRQRSVRPSLEPHARTAIGTRDSRSVVSTLIRVVVFGAALSAHWIGRHGGVAPFVRHRVQDSESRTAVRTAGEWIAMAARP